MRTTPIAAAGRLGGRTGGEEEEEEEEGEDARCCPGLMTRKKSV
jgi:hypothetical protein